MKYKISLIFGLENWNPYFWMDKVPIIRIVS